MRRPEARKVGLVLGLLMLSLIAPEGPAYAVITDPGPVGVAVNPAMDRVYVANVFGESVSVIDGSRSALIDTVPLECVRGEIAVNPMTNRFYVLSCANDGSVFVIDGNTHTTIDNFHVDWGISGIAVNPATNRIYVVSYFYGVWVFDGVSHALIAHLFLIDDPFGQISDVKVNPVTNRIYVLRTKTDGTKGAGVTVIDSVTNRVVTTVELGRNFFTTGLDVNDRTNRIYVTGGQAYVLHVIDGSTHRLIGTIRLAPQEVTGIAVNPASNRIYTVAAPGFVQVIDGMTNATIGRLPVGARPLRVAVNPRTSRVFVSNFDSANVSVLYEGELLGNGSFDRDTDNDGLPEGWKSENLTDQDRLVGNPDLYDGRWAFQFSGATGISKSLTQTVAVPGKVGTTLRLEGFSKADGASTTGGAYQVRAKVFFVDGTTGAFTINFSRGTHEWQRRVSTLTALQDFNSVEVSARYADQTGTVWFDELHVSVRP